MHKIKQYLSISRNKAITLFSIALFNTGLDLGCKDTNQLRKQKSVVPRTLTGHPNPPNTEIEGLTTHIEELKKRVATLEARNKKQIEENAKLNREIDRLRSYSSNSSTTIIREQSNTTSKNLSEIKQQLYELKKRVVEYQEQCSDLEKALEFEDSDIKKIKKEIEDEVKTIKGNVSNLQTANNRIGTLERKEQIHATILAELPGIKTSLNQLKELIGKLEELEDLMKKVEDFNSKIEGIEPNVKEKLKEESNTRTNEIQSVRKELNLLIDNKINTINTELKTTNNALDTESKQQTNIINELNTKINLFENRINNIDIQLKGLTKLENTLKQIEQEFDNNLNTKLAEKTTEIQELIKPLQLSIDTIEKAIKDSNAKVQNLNGEITRVNTLMTALDKTVNDINKLIKDLGTRIDNLEDNRNKPADVEQRIAQENLQQGSQQPKTEENQNNITKIQEDVSKLVSELADLKTRTKKIEEKRLKNLQESSTKMVTPMDDCQKQFDSFNTKIETIKTKYNEQANQIAKLTADLKSVENNTKANTIQAIVNQKIDKISKKMAEQNMQKTTTAIKDTLSHLIKNLIGQSGDNKLTKLYNAIGVNKGFKTLINNALKDLGLPKTKSKEYDSLFQKLNIKETISNIIKRELVNRLEEAIRGILSQNDSLNKLLQKQSKEILKKKKSKLLQEVQTITNNKLEANLINSLITQLNNKLDFNIKPSTLPNSLVVSTSLLTISEASNIVSTLCDNLVPELLIVVHNRIEALDNACKDMKTFLSSIMATLMGMYLIGNIKNIPKQILSEQDLIKVINDQLAIKTETGLTNKENLLYAYSSSLINNCIYEHLSREILQKLVENLEPNKRIEALRDLEKEVEAVAIGSVH